MFHQERSPLILIFLISSVALLLSALKSQGIPYTPASIKRTLENTATPLGAHDTFSVGHGVIQVSEHLYIDSELDH